MARDRSRASMTPPPWRSLAWGAMLAVAATANPASVQQFQPRPGIEALANGATGVFELGAVDFGGAPAVIRALVHNGQVLQVHSKHGNAWLAKRSGSIGGKAIVATKLDELAAIAGGIDNDVRLQAPAIRQQFARAADVTILGATGASRWTPTAAVARGLGAALDAVTSTARAADCMAIGCRVLYRHAAGGGAVFQVTLANDRSAWSFEGYGIVAIWLVPEV